MCDGWDIFWVALFSTLVGGGIGFYASIRAIKDTLRRRGIIE